MEKMSKKIGILAFGDKHWGGLYQYTQSIIDALKNDTTNKYVILCNKDEFRFDNYGLEVRKVEKIKETKLQSIIRSFQCLLFLKRPFFFTEEEKEAFVDITLFLSPTISVYPHFFLNKPFVFTLHDMQERYYPNFFSNYERFLRWLYNRTLAKKASKIICESSFVKNDIVKFTKVDGDKINIIQSPPPEDFLNFKFDSNKFNLIKKKYNLPDKFIFYPAQCWFHKNHIRLVESFKIISKKHDDVYLVLTGSQKNNYNNLINRIKELKLDNKVKHLGYIDYEDLSYFYKMSLFLVMPTLFESVSIPIYEAFSLEVAVCSSNVVALPDQVGDAGLLFDPLDINDMANKMNVFIENKELREEKAKKGLESVVKFNHKEYKERILEVLK
jgi:glycosyltransferase involved in cell wall biosynthesis